WRWSKRNPRFAGALAASIVLAMLNLLAIFAISHLLSIVGHSRLAHRSVASVQFQDLRELTGNSNAVTEAMKTSDATQATVDAAPSSAEEADAHVRVRAARPGTEM